MFQAVEGNLQEIEELLWENSLEVRNYNAGYLYSFKSTFCQCVEDEEGFVQLESLACLIAEPVELHERELDIVLVRAYR